MEQMIIKKPTVKNATVGLLSWEKASYGKDNSSPSSLSPVPYYSRLIFSATSSRRARVRFAPGVRTRIWNPKPRIQGLR